MKVTRACTAAGFAAVLKNNLVPRLGKRAADRISPAEIEQLRLSVRDRPYQASRDHRQHVQLSRERHGMRRVVRRMQVCRMDTLAAYADYLAATPEETKELLSDLLISVAMFFRDPLAFEGLAEKAIKPLFDDLDPDTEDGLRMWTVGCATGEEASNIAILVHEEAARRKLYPHVQIFASDLDEGSLATAREGRYPR